MSKNRSSNVSMFDPRRHGHHGAVTRDTVFDEVVIPKHLAEPSLWDFVTTDEIHLLERRAAERHRASLRSWLNACARKRQAPVPADVLDDLQRGRIRPRLEVHDGDSETREAAR